MHPLRHPRNAALAGIIFIVVGVVYFLVQIGFRHADYAGVTMLGVLGISMAIMFYVLIAGSPSD